SPNGGESFALGGNMPISWTSANFCGNVSLELVDASNNFVALIADNTANDGSHTWPVSGVATGSYKVKIYKTVPSGASPVLDYSNSTFSITNTVPSIDITSPSGGSFNKGCNMNIQWTSVNVGNVSIELVLASNNSVVAVIADPTANDGQFTWETGTNKDGIYPGNIPAGSYKIKMYETGTGAGVDYSNAITITAPSMAFTFPNGGESFALGSSMAIAWNHSNFCGNISIELVNGSNTITVVADDIPNSGAFNWIVGGAAPGTNYRLKIYKTVALPPSPVVDFTDAVFEITSGSGGGNCANITDLDPNDPNEVEAYNAASCLCQLGFVQPQPYGAGNSNGVNPAAEIYRADLAKLVYYAVYKGNLPNPDPSKFFPNPFVDLQSQFSGNPYYDFAKALSYLEFGDGVAPFDRDFLNFLPYGNIQKRYALKVLLEAFNIAPDNSNGGTIQNVSPGDDAYGYVHKAWDMQLITSPGGNATLPVTRQDVFIILHRLILNTGNGGCNTSYTAPTIMASSYFHPGNFTTANLARAVGTGEGYFSHTPNGGFAIPGLNLPLVFAPSYNSYLSELPKAFRPLQPLGGGWTHPYNAYIIRIPAWSEGGYSVSAKTMVFWPSGEIHFYDDATQNPDTYGVFDEITTFGATTIRIKKKNQVEFTFTKYGTAPSDPYMLTLIEDRNGNSIQIVTETAQKTPRRIDRVIGTAGRILEFSYQSGTDFLSSVLDVAGSRIMFFSVNSAGNLAWYQNPKGIKEYYSYGANPGWHLLYEVTRPALNKINNDYDPASRKLLYSKVLENGVEKYRLDVAVSAHYATSNPYISSTLTDINSVTDNEFTTAGFLGTSTINNNGTNISHQNIYGGGDPSLPSQVKYGNLGNSGQTFDLDYLYDAKGNVTKITLPDGSYHQFTYNSQTNDLLTYRNPRNKITTYQYDANANLDKIIDPLGFVTDYTVNSLGLVTQVKNPLNITVNFSYDAQGNRTSISAPLGITSTFSYDNIGRVTSSSNPNNQVTQYLYDAHGQVTKVTRVSNGGNVVTNYSYDANDNPTSVQNANGHSTTMTYDAGDFMKTTTFGNDTKTFTYHKDGLLNTYQKPDGTLLTHVYDDLGRLTNDGYASYVYDNKNNLTQVSKGGNTVSFTYDNLNRLTGSTDYYGKTVGYQYDNNGNVTQLTYPGNFTVAYTYDDNDRMTTASWNGLTTSYTYRNDGLLSKTTYPNGAYCDYFYDAAGRMSGLDNKKSDGTIISTYSFTSDPLGNHLSELVNEPLGIPNFPAQNITGAFNSENEPTAIGGTSFSFDANGNRTAKGSLTSTWDNRDLPLSIGSNNYEYDGTGLRRKAVRNGATTKYVWDVLGMGNVLAETDNAGNITAYYVYGMGLIAKVDASNQSFYYHYDFRGSTIAMTNSGQTVVNQYSYDPFGQVMNSAEAVANPFKYVGKWGVCSEGTGLYHMRARYYDAATGRYLSEDPVWNTNLYGYAENNPIVSIDPKGEAVHTISIGPSVYFGFGGELNISFSYDDVKKDVSLSAGGGGGAGAYASIFDYQVSDGNTQNRVFINNQTCISMAAGTCVTSSVKHKNLLFEPSIGGGLTIGLKSTFNAGFEISAKDTYQNAKRTWKKVNYTLRNEGREFVREFDAYIRNGR
ncbi:MAG: hypothetical protein KDD27_05950, partial [Saprospiraceae bacterium]|nr:hypothetical protein [Saprospiraceae bacterium]